MEIYGRSCVDLSRGRARVENLGADVMAIIHDKDNSMKQTFHPEGLGLVHIGLSDGTVQVYHHHSNVRGIFDKEWSLFKTLTISTHSSLQCMCFLPHKKELVVGCSHSLVIVSTETLMVERRICLMKDVPHKNQVGPVENLTFQGDTLWCSFENSPLIVELEVTSWKPTAAYCIEADLEVYITEVKIGPGERGVCEECGGSASCHQTLRNRASIVTEEEGEPLRPPPRPPRTTKPAAQESSRQEPNDASVYLGNAEQVDQGVRFRCQSESNELLDHQGSVSGIKLDLPTLGETKITSTSSPDLTSRDDVFHTLAEPLEEFIPRPQSEALGKSRQLGNKAPTPQNRSTIRRAPPPPPPPGPRRSLPSDYDGVHVQSLLCVRDTLWVGSSFGEILVIGVQKRKDLTASPLPPSPSYGQKTFLPSFPAAGAGCHFHRTSLNLESKQRCNLKSMRMVVDMEAMEAMEPECRTQSGGVEMLVRARNMVVAVRCISRKQEIREAAEITVWDMCSADRIDSIRQYWRSLQSSRMALLD